MFCNKKMSSHKISSVYKFIKCKQNNTLVPIKYLIRFDGGCDQNPGEGGSGTVIYRLYASKEMKKIAGLGKYHPNTTNNEAEYWGLLQGLEWMHQQQIKHFLIEGNSMLIINHLKGTWNCNAANLKPLYMYSNQLLEHAENVGIRHIYRDKNGDADQLSRDVRPIKQNISILY